MAFLGLILIHRPFMGRCLWRIFPKFFHLVFCFIIRIYCTCHNFFRKVQKSGFM